MRALRTLALTALALGMTAPLAGAATAKAPSSCNGSRALCAKRFDRVVLPATHNSMSSTADGFQGANQPVGIPAQLKDGIRGLLFDTYYGHPNPDGSVATDNVKTSASSLYLCHVVCEIGATRLDVTLRAIESFVEKHPDTVLLIDNEDYVSPADFAAAVKSSGLSDHVYRGSTTTWPTLATMIAKHQQVVLLAEHRAGVVPWYHPAYKGIVQETPYTFETPDLLTDAGNWPPSCVPNRGGTTAPLFLMNHWSPPSAPTPAVSAAVNATATIVGRARACQAARGRLPTIVAVDQYRSGGLLPAVRQLNGVLDARREMLKPD